MPNFTCKLSDPATPLTHSWEHTVGSGHAPLALRADWQAQLRRCHQELGFRHVRFHALLSDQMGTLICQNDKLLYSFFNADRIMDFLLSIGMRPFVELSFMPETLASGKKTVFHYQANVTPPKDYKQWATLIKKLVSHWVERYGLAEVSQWFFEVWNEPNLEAFGTGKQNDYFQLYRSTVEAIKSVDGSLKVGGPATAQNAWVPEFLEYCEKHKLAADFVSTHYYPTDAFGKIGADTAAQLAHAPPDIMQKRARETCANAQGLPIYYTEWNISSNPRDPFHDEPFAAALATNIIMGVQGLVQGYSYWTFSDIFEENYFPSVPFHGGFGLLNIYGIAKPIYRAFELLHRLGDEVLPIHGKHKTVSAWVTRQAAEVTVLLTNHAMPEHAIKTELVSLQLKDSNRPLTAYLERVDKHHANPLALWRAMKNPEYLSPREVEQLQAASCLTQQPHPLQYEKRSVQLEVSLPPHSIAALTIEFAPA
ncbi:MAG: GH39 family glycosyl hydrolase [Chthoniobacterales bacterium]